MSDAYGDPINLLTRVVHCPMEPTSLLKHVERQIRTRRLSIAQAAKAIGVTVGTLENHLRGEHVRSDSAQKYENWLAGRSMQANVFALDNQKVRRSPAGSEQLLPDLPSAPASPHLVVDIFSGCGGLSLGFDLLGNGAFFETVLALDNQAPPITVYNRNAAFLARGGSVGRQVDLTEFLNETEFLAFYLKHVATLKDDEKTLKSLDHLCGAMFRQFRQSIIRIDEAYIDDLNKARERPSWKTACAKLDKQALIQTSVTAFHDKLRLPRTGTRTAIIPAVLWGESHEGGGKLLEPGAEMRAEAEWEWEAELSALQSRTAAKGKGQLTSSARRVAAFAEFVRSAAFEQIKSAWIKWRSRRLELRGAVFTNEQFSEQIRSLYKTSYPASVLVGGPPCQGFSRIGRGKIRSLRDALVHVHSDSQAGDSRNLLFRQYVMVLGALQPTFFVFENVQHFQSKVSANGADFQATDVLAEAIANVSGGDVSYAVTSKIIDASMHGIPQTRQRFFMCGARNGAFESSNVEQFAQECLKLPAQSEIPLAVALQGLSKPIFAGGDTYKTDSTSERTPVARPITTDPAYTTYVEWISQPLPGSHTGPRSTDAHVARVARADDAALFSLMGPGKRWMDYRADDSQTLFKLRNLVSALQGISKNSFETLTKAAQRRGQRLPSAKELKDLSACLDGSLPIRMLLEQIGEKLGAPHHLSTESYLAKRDGHHGDWVARLDPTRPAKTMVSHMGKDTYAYVHPAEARTISVREAARIQSFPDWFLFGDASLTDAFRMIGNAVPPLLSAAIASRVAQALSRTLISTSADGGNLQTRNGHRAVGG